MIRLINKFFFILILTIFIVITYLSFFGIKTNKFNDVILNNVLKINKNLDLSLGNVNYFLNPLKFKIIISTENPKILLSDSNLEIKSIRTEASLISLIKGQFFIDDWQIFTKEIKIKDAISLAKLFQNSPKLFILDKVIKEGTISANIFLNFDVEKKIKENFEVKGFVKKASINFLNQHEIKDLSFAFNITKDKYVLSEIETNFNKIKLISELIEIKKKNKLFIVNGRILNDVENFDIQNIQWLFNNFLNNLDIKKLKFSSINDFSFSISEKFKFSDFKLDTNLNLNQAIINKKLTYLKNYFPNYTNQIKLENHKIKIKFNKNELNIEGDGEFVFSNISDRLIYKVIKKDNQFLFDTIINIESNFLNIDLLDFEKKKNIKSNISLKGIKNKNEDILFELISLNENKNQIKIKNLLITKDLKVKNIDSVNVHYVNSRNNLNKFKLKKNNKDYIIQGENLDATKIIDRILDTKENNVEIFKNFNPKIKISLKKTLIDKDNYMNNLSGHLYFKNNKINELDIASIFQNNKKINFSVKTNNKNETITKILSSYPKPLVEKYDFIEGFEEGELYFYSSKQKDKSESILIIDNFKVKKVPALAKLLSLASLQGISDLLTGEGIRFTDFEMNFSNEKGVIKIDEIYAIGPAISLLMSGYIEKEKLVSLRGTLVPATTINKVVASIPLVGNILIGKKTGEGVFGVSFKIKGPPKNLKTTVNPIKTLTPRFISRTLEKIKKNN